MENREKIKKQFELLNLEYQNICLKFPDATKNEMLEAFYFLKFAEIRTLIDDIADSLEKISDKIKDLNMT